MASPTEQQQPSGWSIESIQSLIVAFTLAMAFRSFVLEGFSIPTGSMGPTLMGAHVRLRSDFTGYEFAVDGGAVTDLLSIGGKDAPKLAAPIRDPMISPAMDTGRETLGALYGQMRSGDRVLVLKSLYPFVEPKRYDVVVFKNPTDPFGDTQNYIKRLVGLPDERLLLIDGDVFAGTLDGRGCDDMHVQRKPEHVQRAVWQKVFDQDYQPIDRSRLEEISRRPWPGVPFSSPGWSTDDPRAWVWSGGDPGELSWEWTRRAITDWNAYNMIRDFGTRNGEFAKPFPVSDIRVCAAVSCNDWSAFSTRLEMTTRGHAFVWSIAGGEAKVSVTRSDEDAPAMELGAPLGSLFAGGAPTHDVEFWQVDQSMSIFVDGHRVVHAEYDWGVEERIAMAFNGLSIADYSRNPTARQPTAPRIRWSLEGGAPITLRRVRLDRDIYYRPDVLRERDQFASNGPFLEGLAFAIDPLDPAKLDDNHFMMCGDNSAASRDGRLWGRPHPLVTAQLGEDDPFLVPRELLLGKACAVYFPAPMPLWKGGRNLVPDFGRLRFIR